MPEEYIERRLIIGAITSTTMLRETEHVLSTDLLSNEASIIVDLCLEYYRKHKKAPGHDIEILFSNAKRHGKIDNEQADFIEDILQGMSDEYEKSDNKILVDEVLNYIDERRLIILSEDIRAEVERGNNQEAHALLAKHKPSERLSKGDSNFFTQDPEWVRQVFEETSKPLIQYSGKLGQLWNKHLVSGGFVGLLGPEKVGKTWILMDIGFQAQRCGLNVAFFAAGDMNKKEMELRKFIYLAKRSNDPEYCDELLIPVLDCWYNQTGECEAGCGIAPMHGQKYPEDWDKEFLAKYDMFKEHQPCKECIGTIKYKGSVWFEKKQKTDPLTWKEGFKIQEKYLKRVRRSQWKFSEHENDSLNCRMIENKLQVWYGQGFKPHVILVDYPDIMADDEEDRRLEFRHRENKKWKKLRGKAHKWDCLVVAPTQADSGSYDQKWIGKKNYSEDKRKYSHTTAFYSLNQTDDEAELGIFRIGQMFVRSGKRGFRYATVLQRLEIGRPNLGSF